MDWWDQYLSCALNTHDKLTVLYYVLIKLLWTQSVTQPHALIWPKRWNRCATIMRLSLSLANGKHRLWWFPWKIIRRCTKINRMNPIFSSQVWEDYLYWLKTDKLIANRIHALIKAIQQNLFERIGKPEPLKHRLSSYGSRRLMMNTELSIKSLTTICPSLSFVITINFAPLRPAKRLIHMFRWCWWRAVIVKFR